MNDTTTHGPLPEDFDWNDAYTGAAADFVAPDAEVLALAAARPPGEVLDVGCGAGGLLAALGERGWRLHGVDVAAKAIAAAREVLAAHGLAAELEVADAASWTPSRTYDLVTSTFALPLTRGAQQGVYRVLRAAIAPGGTVIVKDFDTRMSRVPAFGGIDLVELDELVAAFDGFELERAEIVTTPRHDHAGPSDDDAPWTAALLVARRPR